jgi:hypothetical protein
MGILERVLQKLRQAGFPAELAYSGKKHAAVTEVVAAVHMGKVDRGACQTAVAVNILCPAGMGGTACEEAGLRAVEALHDDGVVCTMQGCRYDGLTRCFCVDITAVYAGMAVGNGALGLGFSVSIDGKILPYALEFTAEEQTKHELRYSMGERTAKGISFGCGGWDLCLVEMIPVGGEETVAQVGSFSLQITGLHGSEVYQECVWTSVKREFTRQGLKCTRKGIAMGREVN